ncbi:unnamed protein product [Coffea canephora]|uniref:Leucine-rich repeat-containing N-terminal plant-type domain-containing protein n=1 Tax=Coffea canephora TaxID=49390 RepID=A0A068TXQ5_COFCA|nr:unnamed protein product [Coffea canephora]
MQRTYFLFAGALVLLHFITTSSAGASIANNRNNTIDLNAFLAFKSTIFDPQRIIPTNWSTSSSVCNWIGITCNTRHQRVAAINLSYMGIAGTIPPQLGNLSFLVWLSVSNNSFHGHLPTELSRLRRLKYINLKGNAFEGEFPSWLGCLSALWYINFEYNRFSGSLSGRLSNFTKLEVIALAFNFFTGNLSEEFSALPKFRVLEIEYTQLAGPLPQALFNLSSLQKIGFTSNSLSGYLPARICDYLPQLQELYLSRNYFEGEIPSGIGECSGLQFLSLSYNKFRGYIPNGVWNLTTLTAIDLGENDLTGIIPQEIGNLSKLEVLMLGLNRLRGPIPLKLFNSSTSIGNLSSSLESIYAARCGIISEIPSSIGNLSNLIGLSFATNSLTGVIPTTIKWLLKLQRIDLSDNQIQGAIPSEFCNLLNLEGLRLGQNKLSGMVPSCLGNVTTLRYYGLEGLVSTSCDVYSFGITLMETFTKRKPKDEMFTEALSLRRWVQDCLPDSVIQVIDRDLLHPENELVQTKINCISSVLQLGLSCTTDAPKERIDMKEVLRALQKIKLQFIKDIMP